MAEVTNDRTNDRAGLGLAIGQAGMKSSFSALEPVSVVAGSRARLMMLASQKLVEPSRSLYDRLFIKGEAADTVRLYLNMTPVEFNDQRAIMLRALMTAAQ